MSATFCLIDKRRALQDGTFPIKISAGCGTGIYLSTGISVKLWEWDPESGRVIDRKDAKRLNSFLEVRLLRTRARMLQFGSLHAVSVGFRATKKGHIGDEERGEDPNVYYYAGQELLEVSVVNIPSNANALKRSMEEEEASREYEEKAVEPETVTDVTDEAPADYTSTIARARALLAKNV